MHPYTARAIAVERMADMRNQAAAYRRGRSDDGTASIAGVTRKRHRHPVPSCKLHKALGIEHLGGA